MHPIYVSLHLDDYPLNASYFWRLQMEAIGFPQDDGGTGSWSRNWRAQHQAPFMTNDLLREFIHLMHKYGLRGKWTVLPCPGCLGRLDESIRMLSDSDRIEMISLIKEEIAGNFEITPEVLTHSLVYFPDSNTIIPHSETAWITKRCVDEDQDQLQHYINQAFSILNHVQIPCHGLSVGGISDPTHIAKGEPLDHPHHIHELGKALANVVKQWNPDQQETFLFTEARPTNPKDRELKCPVSETYSEPGMTVFSTHYYDGDCLLDVFHADRSLKKAIDTLITEDLESGTWIEAAEKRGAFLINIHAQTLSSKNTGMGLYVLREAVARFHKKYGSRIQWVTPLELWQARSNFKNSFEYSYSSQTSTSL